MNTQIINQKINTFAATWDISGFVMVLKDKQFIHDEFYGYQDRKANLTTKARDTYSLSLRSHFFLGLAVMVLIDQGKIKLNDTLDQYIPEYTHAKEIKINHLIFHSTGMTDFLYNHQMVELQHSMSHQEKSEDERYRIEAMLYDQTILFNQVFDIVKDEPLLFIPGQLDDHWSATNLLFLQEVIERISQQKLFDFLSQYIFKPWGMSNTVKGAFASTVSYGCIQGLKLVRLPIINDIDHSITMTIDDVKAMMTALVDQKVFKESTWKKALKLNKQGYSILGENANGVTCAESVLLGYEMNLYFSQRDSLAYVHLTNESQLIKTVDGDLQYFRKDFRETIEAEFTYPKNTRLDRYSEKNAWHAIDLKIADDQQRFVLDAKTTLAYALINPRIRKTYVLMEDNRSIGLLVLSIDKKHNYFNIDVVLIDYRFQNRGFGKIMLTKAVEILKYHGAKKIEIGVNKFNIPAQKLYKSLNFYETAVYEQGMTLQLDL